MLSNGKSAQDINVRNGLARLPSRLERDAEWLEVKTELARAQQSKSKNAIKAAEERFACQILF